MSLNICVVSSGPVLLVFMKEGDDGSHVHSLRFCKETVFVNVSYVSYYIKLFLYATHNTS